MQVCVSVCPYRTYRSQFLSIFFILGILEPSRHCEEAFFLFFKNLNFKNLFFKKMFLKRGDFAQIGVYSPILLKFWLWAQISNTFKNMVSKYKCFDFKNIILRKFLMFLILIMEPF